MERLDKAISVPMCSVLTPKTPMVPEINQYLKNAIEQFVRFIKGRCENIQIFIDTRLQTIKIKGINSDLRTIKSIIEEKFLHHTEGFFFIRFIPLLCCGKNTLTIENRFTNLDDRDVNFTTMLQNITSSPYRGISGHEDTVDLSDVQIDGQALFSSRSPSANGDSPAMSVIVPPVTAPLSGAGPADQPDGFKIGEISFPSLKPQETLGTMFTSVRKTISIRDLKLPENETELGFNEKLKLVTAKLKQFVQQHVWDIPSELTSCLNDIIEHQDLLGRETSYDPVVLTKNFEAQAIKDIVTPELRLQLFKMVLPLLWQLLRLINQCLLVYKSTKEQEKEPIALLIKSEILKAIYWSKAIIINSSKKDPLNPPQYLDYVEELAKTFLSTVIGEIPSGHQPILADSDIIEIADPHATLDLVCKDLYSVGLIDKNGHWIGLSERIASKKGPQKPVKLVVNGDLVDRGVFPLETFLFFLKLQHEARLAKEKEEEVIITLGNHEWLYLNYIDDSILNNFCNTREQRFFLDLLTSAISEGKIQMAYLDKVGRIYVHGGYCSSFLEHYYPELLPSDMQTKQRLIDESNKLLFSANEEVDFRKPIFLVGKARGGDNVPGGLVWFDISKEEDFHTKSLGIQIIGHVPQDHINVRGEFVLTDTRCFLEGLGRQSLLLINTDVADPKKGIFAFEYEEPVLHTLAPRGFDLSQWRLHNLQIE